MQRAREQGEDESEDSRRGRAPEERVWRGWSRLPAREPNPHGSLRGGLVRGGWSRSRGSEPTEQIDGRVGQRVRAR